MSNKKKTIRKSFRECVFKRSYYHCAICGIKGQDRQSGGDLPNLDAHHITNRSHFKNGGYTLSNGISLCEDCHIKAETYDSKNNVIEGFSPEELYQVISSSLLEAKEDDLKLE